jgi:hypothetical protein
MPLLRSNFEITASHRCGCARCARRYTPRARTHPTPAAALAGASPPAPAPSLVASSP